MIDKNLLLKSIELSGSADEFKPVIRQIINQNMSNVIDNSSGKDRIKPSIVGKFNLILAQPVSAMSSLSIRCFSCNRVISYPAWHYSIEYAVNVFHYFVCFRGEQKVNLDCKRKR